MYDVKWASNRLLDFQLITKWCEKLCDIKDEVQKIRGLKVICTKKTAKWLRITHFFRGFVVKKKVVYLWQIMRQNVIKLLKCVSFNMSLV